MQLVALKRIERQKGDRHFYIPPGATFESTGKDEISHLKAKAAANPATESDIARAKELGLKETEIPGRVRSLRERRARREAADEMSERNASVERIKSGGNPADNNDPGDSDENDGSDSGETTGAGGGMDTTKLSSSTGTSRSGGARNRI